MARHSGGTSTSTRHPVKTPPESSTSGRRGDPHHKQKVSSPRSITPRSRAIYHLEAEPNVIAISPSCHSAAKSQAPRSYNHTPPPHSLF